MNAIAAAPCPVSRLPPTVSKIGTGAGTGVVIVQNIDKMVNTYSCPLDIFASNSNNKQSYQLPILTRALFLYNHHVQLIIIKIYKKHIQHKMIYHYKLH